MACHQCNAAAGVAGRPRLAGRSGRIENKANGGIGGVAPDVGPQGRSRCPWQGTTPAAWRSRCPITRRPARPDKQNPDRKTGAAPFTGRSGDYVDNRHALLFGLPLKILHLGGV